MTALTNASLCYACKEVYVCRVMFKPHDQCIVEFICMIVVESARGALPQEHEILLRTQGGIDCIEAVIEFMK